MDFHPLQIEGLAANYLQLILLPTEQCNFRCTYCYETFEHKKMSSDVVSGVKALIDRRASELDRLDTDWFGGEPLTAFEIVRDISLHAQATMRSYGGTYCSGMTTNGYLLTRDMLAACAALDIRRFQITLDGTREAHNRSRRQASGAGSFDRIWANLESARDSSEDVSIMLRLHFTEETIEAVEALGRRLKEEFSHDPRFTYNFRPIAPFGGPGNASVKPVSWTRRREIERQLWERSGLPRRAPPSTESLCYAGRANSLVVRSTGRLAKCTVAFEEDHNDIGRLLPDGSIEVDQEKFQRWLAPLMEQRWDRTGCPLGFVALDAMNLSSRDPVQADEGRVFHGLAAR